MLEVANGDSGICFLQGQTHTKVLGKKTQRWLQGWVKDFIIYKLFIYKLFTNYLQKKIDLQNQFWIEFVNPSSATLDGFSV